MKGFLTDYGNQLRVDYATRASTMHHTHVHVQYELYFCVENVEQNSVINGVEYSYHHPCVIFSPPYTVHSMSAKSNFERYVFYFAGDMFSSYPDRALPLDINRFGAGRMFVLAEEQAQYLKDLIIMSGLNKKETPSAEQELALLLFLHKLYDFCPKDKIIEVGGSSSYIQQVIQYAVEHFRDNLDGESIARQFLVSRSKLDRDFKRFAGITLHEFCESCRINHAKCLLEFHPEVSVGQIALQCGFESETWFYPFFKRHTGQTPLEYRQEHSKKHINKKEK